MQCKVMFFLAQSWAKFNETISARVQQRKTTAGQNILKELVPVPVLSKSAT